MLNTTNTANNTNTTFFNMSNHQPPGNGLFRTYSYASTTLSSAFNPIGGAHGFFNSNKPFYASTPYPHGASFTGNTTNYSISSLYSSNGHNHLYPPPPPPPPPPQTQPFMPPKPYKQQEHQQKEQSHNYMSEYEKRLLHATSPLNLDTSLSSSSVTTITNSAATGNVNTLEVFGMRGIWANKHESDAWRGSLPLTAYALNTDPEPELVRKQLSQKHNITQTQQVHVRYLRPETPPTPGPIIIRQEASVRASPAPPLVLRQRPPASPRPPIDPIVIREAPPTPPAPVPAKVIRVPGKRLPPAPRKVILERLPPLPARPPAVLVERWLPYEPVKRRVVFEKAEALPEPEPTKNVIVQWEPPEVHVDKEVSSFLVFLYNLVFTK